MKRIALGAWVLLALVPAGAAAQTLHTHRHDFSGAERWAKYFEDPERDRWQKRHQAIRALALAPFGQSVDRAAAPPAASVPTAASRADSSVPNTSAVFGVYQHTTDEAAPTF